MPIFIKICVFLNPKWCFSSPFPRESTIQPVRFPGFHANIDSDEQNPARIICVVSIWTYTSLKLTTQGKSGTKKANQVRKSSQFWRLCVLDVVRTQSRSLLMSVSEPRRYGEFKNADKIVPMWTAGKLAADLCRFLATFGVFKPRRYQSMVLDRFK